MNDGPFTDDDIRHMLAVHETQSAIISRLEIMAQFMAEAARASHEATGDLPHVALDKWLKVLRARVLETLNAPNTGNIHFETGIEFDRRESRRKISDANS